MGEAIVRQHTYNRNCMQHDRSAIPAPPAAPEAPAAPLAEGAPLHPELARTLDPADWDAMRALGHRMVDDVMDLLRDVREQPVWRPIPDAVAARFHEPLPREGVGAARVYDDFRELVLPYPAGTIHPRFWGRVCGTGTPMGVLAAMLAAAMNDNVATIDSASVRVEAQVIEWCRELMGFPTGASGVLVSGCSTANLVALAAAREARGGRDVRRRGVDAPGRLTLYGSEEIHNSIDRAAAILGLGTDAVRKIPVDREFRLRLDSLEDAIARDRAAGLRPFCIVGSAGTVGTGAVDDLHALADLAQRLDLWFHVDGAFGAIAALSPALRPRLAGMERADSLAFDFHKWMYVPYGAAAVLVRDRDAHRRAFAPPAAAYLAGAARGPEADPERFNEYAPELSREARALKVWMSLREHGVEGYARMVEQNVAQAAYLAERVREHPNLELLAPVPLDIVCFRYTHAGLSAAALDEVNAELLTRLQERGIALPTRTRIRDRFAIRVAITNQRSRREDFDLLVDSVLAIGREVVRERRERRA